MKKLLAGAVLGATMLIGPVGANGAIHFGPGCFTGAVGTHVFNYCFSDVVTPSGNANARFKGELLSPAPDKAVTITGFGCIASFPDPSGFTTDTKITITPSGNVSGHCKFHP